MDAAELQKRLKAGSLSGLCLLYGEDDYTKELCSRRIAETLGGALPDFNLQRFDGARLDLAQLAAAVNNLPVMSDRKCVVVKDPDPEGLRAAEWKEFEGLAKELPAECVLVLHFDSVKPNPRKDKRFSALLKLAAKNGAAVECARPSRSQAARLLVRRAQKLGARLDEETAGFLYDRCGADLNLLLSETEKLCAGAGGGPVTKEQAERLTAKPMTASIYDLARAVSAGRVGEGLRLLDELFYQKEEPVVILSALSGAFCDLYRARAASLSGVQEARIAADFNYRGREFRVRNALRDARGMSLDYLERSLALLLRADARLKSSREAPRTVLERLLVELGTERRSGGAARLS